MPLGVEGSALKSPVRIIKLTETYLYKGEGWLQFSEVCCVFWELTRESANAPELGIL